MSASHATITRPALATPSDRVRQIAVVVGTAIALVGAFLGSGAAGGTPVQDAADGAFASDATLLAPAGPAFAIWSVIYLGLVGYAVYQALPGQASRTLHRSAGWWILVVQAGLVGLSLAVIAILLVVLVIVAAVLRLHPSEGWADTVLVHGTMGQYLGWVTIATVANVTALLVRAGFSGLGLSPDAWGVAVLVVAGLISVALAVWNRGRLTPALATAWGVFWIGVARSTGDPASGTVAVTAYVVAAVILVAAVVVRVATVRSSRGVAD
ncbi:MAG: tryptophan-rich sensory protein [Microbacterium sp.]|nr:tryptophan-rich sensory protein [Microbacterium sp.]